MTSVARLAIGITEAETDIRPILRALLRELTERDVHVQCFLAHAAFTGFQELRSWSGAVPRHLDSWLMSPQHCRDSFIKGIRGADVAMVVGRYRSFGPAWSAARSSHNSNVSPGFRESGSFIPNPPALDPAEAGHRGCICKTLSGGVLEPLGNWLDLTSVVVKDASELALGTCTNLPENAGGVFLVNLPRDRAVRAAVEVEALWGVPLLGGVAPWRGRQHSARRGERPGATMTYWDERRFFSLLDQSRCRPLPAGPGTVEDFGGRITVAVARDEAFRCYFAETLDALERRGARLVDFSPLHDESLPHGVDCVYLGCGDCTPYAAALAQNHCIKESLRAHVRRGGRVYAEGAGAAYLCRWMEIKPGCMIPGAGLLPASGRRMPQFGEPSALALHLRKATWLGPAGTEVRGYRNWEWWFEPESLTSGLITEPGFEYDVIGESTVLGSLLHLDFAAQEHLLSAFFRPARPRMHSFMGR
ncbi:hypothetical protein JCM17478_13120 [Thermopirellula anaerolimosa]